MAYSKYQTDLDFFSMGEMERVRYVLNKYPNAAKDNERLCDYYRRTFGSIDETRVIAIAKGLRE